MEKTRLSFKEQMRLILPYAWHNIEEQIFVVVPVCLYIVLFQFIILQYGLTQIAYLIAGIACVFVGLAFFLEGIRIGPVPICEIVGNALPKKHSKFVVLTFAFFLGLLGAFGEPVLGTLQMAGASLKEEHAPLLYALLVGKPAYMVWTVAFGVGIAVFVCTLRFLYGWSLKFLILPLISVVIVLTIIAARDPLLASAIGLAWDTGAVIVGPVLCPLVLALGLGVCRASGKNDPNIAGFGMVGLISVVPIALVVILTFALYLMRGEGHHSDPHGVVVSATPTAAGSEAVAANFDDVSLPQTLDFSEYYPKLRILNLPTHLDYSEFSKKIDSLSAEQKNSFLIAYTVDQHHGSIQLRQRIAPEIRQALPALLTQLGYDYTKNPLTVFKQAYQISVDDEKTLRGTISLKMDIPAPVKREVEGILKSIGYLKIGPLLFDSLLLGAQAILPIFSFLYIVMLLLKEKGPPLGQVVLALGFAIFGLCLFFFGLSIGLGSLGNSVGCRLPTAFIDYLPLFPEEGSLYSAEIGKVIVVLFTVVLGYGATLAEPAFNVLGQQVEDVTQGTFKKNLFSQAVALGVGIGAGFGVISLLYNINLLYLLLPPYILLVLLTILNTETFVNIAWDGGAVTTGPVTVPLKLAIGLSLSTATGAGEGFGVLALASAYPVLNILLLGLFLKEKKNPVEAS